MNILGKIRMFFTFNFVSNEERTIEERSLDTQNVRVSLIQLSEQNILYVIQIKGKDAICLFRQLRQQ